MFEVKADMLMLRVFSVMCGETTAELFEMIPDDAEWRETLPKGEAEIEAIIAERIAADRLQRGVG